ncbi:MAG: S1 RNA-binding domain-containing protein [Chloroflexi bacterium]|nr:MAG: S1 RNA-binding domain-containing protein [Chloroflexota bacterium]
MTEVETPLQTDADELDFAALLEISLAETKIERGDIVTGTVLSVDHHGLIVDVGWKRDGIVPRRDIDRLNMTPEDFEVDQEIDVAVVRLEDAEGNLILSASQARQSEDWKQAEALLAAEEPWTGKVIDSNRGGLIIPFGHLRGFVPASHVSDLPRGINEAEREAYLRKLIGREITVKVIEVNRRRRRLVFSQRDAERETREARKDALLQELAEGEVRRGVVSGLRDFGAFVDLGGADGLIHISELAWHRVSHPSEVVNVGDEIEVYVLRLDEDGKRIGLSLKRLQPNPWALVDEMYHIGQLIEGTVSRVADFGAFISMEPGIEALLHVSQIASINSVDPQAVIRSGMRLLLRVISIESDKQRLGLSLKDVTPEEVERWENEVDNDAVAELIPVEEVVAEEETEEATEAPVAEVAEADA